ncbi:MerR family transcriptional regulator [Aeromicrobium erythreum]|uniref:MerR family transcriptional regulator n=1 Tax=Aeromicrobium erythreum TaxID=2041 RepID=A0A0U4CKV1_9ACTN|nr:MerR family transcriptional regulator [Aeromicrobium erythreum]
MRRTLGLQVDLKSRWHDGPVRVGAAAERVGVAAHVLRHWEDEGVVVPDRTPAGHRVYTDEHLHRLEIVRSCQRVGLRLWQIRLVLHRDAEGRDDVIAQHLEHLRRQRAELDAAEAFLTHVLTCEHDLMSRCERCSAFPSD